MTAHSSHMPIYTPTELAGLVAKHDREHPDHTEDCGCHNGLIWTLRIYFAPTISVGSDDSPRPYVPPDVLSPRTHPPTDHCRACLSGSRGCNAGATKRKRNAITALRTVATNADCSLWTIRR